MLSRLIKPYVTAEDLSTVIADFELRNWMLTIIKRKSSNSYYLEFEYGY